MNITRVFDRLKERDGQLDLSELELTDEDLSAVALVEGVRDLSIGQNPLITIDGLRALAQLGTTLEGLHLWELPIDDRWLRVLPTLFPRLKQLSFGGEDLIAVSSEGLQALAELTCLEAVTTDDDDHAEELQRLYPGLKVEF